MALRFDGRVAVVTGAGRGLGAAYARLLRSLGATVVVNDVEPDDAEIDVDDTHDVADAAGAQALVDGAVERHGRIDALIANAGIMRWGGVVDAEVDDHLAVHVGGSFLTARAAWPHFVEQGAGRIVLTTSTGLLGLPRNVAYATAKGGVIGLMRALAFAGRRHGIGVNAIAPAASTRLAGEGGPDLPPALVAPMAAYLAHPDCPASGEIYTAGGGRFARLFIGSTPGWVGGSPTIDDVAAHWRDIEDEGGYDVPADLMAWSARFLGRDPGRVTGAAPILHVADAGAALAFYAGLGFETRAYARGGYGFATTAGVELHLGALPAGDPRIGTATAYLFVDDADAVAARWRAAGAEVHGPEDTQWGRREGSLVDPDGNVLRFGSRLA